jgi:glutamate transport system substrate-binding protein
MLAHYITGKSDADAVELVITTVDTRETLIQNGDVDAVFATYTITEPRAQKVAFAGPYYQSGTSVAVRADDTAITGVGDLNGCRATACSGGSRPGTSSCSAASRCSC